jgi:arylsulfatase A-like enzyme
VPAGTVVDQPIHLVDMFPTLASLAGASLAKCRPLDGVNVWPAIAEGKPSPREEVVYGIEPFRATVRKGGWKLVWQTTLPSKVELFDLKKDASETTNLAEQNPQKVAELQQRAQALAREAKPALFLRDALGAAKDVLMGSVVLAEDAKELAELP